MKRRVTALLLCLTMALSATLSARAEEIWERYDIEGTVIVSFSKPWEELIVPDGITEIQSVDGSHWLERVVLPPQCGEDWKSLLYGQL